MQPKKSWLILAAAGDENPSLFQRGDLKSPFNKGGFRGILTLAVKLAVTGSLVTQASSLCPGSMAVGCRPQAGDPAHPKIFILGSINGIMIIPSPPMGERVRVRVASSLHF